jgi:YjjG family noncanonical pyrimidine nucleotidase
MEKQFEWLLFDLDNTILDFSASSKLAFSAVYEALEVDKTLKDVYRLYSGINHSVWQEREAGKLSAAEVKTKRWTLLCEVLDIEKDASYLNDVYFEGIKKHVLFVEGAEEVLEQLVGNYRMMIVTNGLSEVQWSRINDTNIQRFFEHIVISDEIGIAKPAREFFDHCAELMGFPSKDKVLVIGDTKMSDIKGGNDFGYATCWYNHKQSDQEGPEANFLINNISELQGLLL